MIQINLLADSIQPNRPAGTTSRNPALSVSPSDSAIDLDLGDLPRRRSRLPLVLGAGAALVVGGGAAFYALQPSEPALPAPTVTKAEKPAPTVTKAEKPAPKPEPKPQPAKVDSAKPAAKDTAKVAEAKPEPKPAPLPPPPPAPKPAPKPEPKVEPKVEPKPVAVAAGPSVRAPGLPPNALTEVLSHGHAAAAPKEKPNRFDALTPTGRTAYQKFAFERLLAILRQVTPGEGIGFSKVKISSPGMLSVQGTVNRPEALVSFQKGLAAQSLADTSTATGKDQAFALVARLPFNPSFGGIATPATDVKKALQQALDLAAPQGLAFKASAARTETVGASKRTSWTLTGQGGWDGIAGWLAGLQSASSPIGFTELTIVAGDKGKLQVTVTAVCYGP